VIRFLVASSHHSRQGRGGGHVGVGRRSFPFTLLNSAGILITLCVGHDQGLSTTTPIASVYGSASRLQGCRSTRRIIPGRGSSGWRMNGKGLVMECVRVPIIIPIPHSPCHCPPQQGNQPNQNAQQSIRERNAWQSIRWTTHTRSKDRPANSRLKMR
jgi:hypothetical protein